MNLKNVGEKGGPGNVDNLFPKFNEEGNLNPRGFVNLMERYFDMKGTDDEWM